MDDELPHIQRATTSGILAFFSEVEALMKAERAELPECLTPSNQLFKKRSTLEPRPPTPPAQAQ